MAPIDFHQVCKTFGNVTVLHNVSFHVDDGEFLVLVGPSGCGKSTLLRCVAGLERIDAGEIYIGDTIINNVPPQDRNVAMVFQRHALYPHMNVYDNIAFPLMLHHETAAAIATRVHHVATLLGIEGLLQRKPHALSGGQQQRVALGRALVCTPAVLLMDEPLSSLDALLRVQIRAEIRRAYEQFATTCMYVTHDQAEAMTMGSRIALLQNGVLQQLDTPRRVYDAPVNMFVAGFIGSPHMNFFGDAVVGCGDNGITLTIPGVGVVPLPDYWAHALAAYCDTRVVMGIRPEHIYHARSHDATNHQVGRPFDVTIRAVEDMGSDVVVHGVCGRYACVCRFPGNQQHELIPGGHVAVVIDSTRVHVFANDEGNRAIATIQTNPNQTKPI